MSKFKTAIVGGTFLLSTFLSANASNALPVEDFNAIDIQNRGNVLQQVVVGAYKYLEANGTSEDKLQCIRDYFTAQQVTIENNTVVINKGAAHVLDEIEKATRLGQTDIPVENIVMGVIDNQCSPKTNVADTPKAPTTATPPTPSPAG